MEPDDDPRARPSRGDRLRDVTVGEPARLDGPVALSPADPRWPALFEAEARRLRAALGERAIRVEHVGSTSVVDLAAKPIIDVLLVVDDSGDEAAYVAPLEASGYVLRIREPDWYEHLFSQGAPEIERMLRFRDHLRDHPDDRELYERSKRELAARRWRYVQDYADAKSSVVEEILERAQRRG
jgi:GrpB-like predicted nucleotidyltransferase (UPF0157 family)